MTHPKQQLFEQFARVARALASPARLEILDLLAQGEKTVEQTAAQTRLGVKNASAHLRALREARLVETRKEGTRVFYRLAADAVARVVREIQALAAERLAEVERISRDYLDDQGELEPIGADELVRQLEAGTVTLLDVRPGDEFRAGHLPGAVSMPLEELERRLDEIPQGRPVVAYCRGRYCVFAVDAVRTLRERGYEAVRVELGVPEWRAAGYEVATAADSQGIRATPPPATAD